MAYLDLNGLRYFMQQLKPRLIPAGAVQAFASTSIPTGWLLCNGQAVSRTSYADLFAVIGTKYGTGDGRTTFNLPNLTGYTIIGGNSGELGRKVGASAHVLNTNEMPRHGHPTGSENGYWRWGGKVSLQSGNDSWAWRSQTAEMEGGGQAHNNMQPSMYLHYCIKV